jgi:hypothetical protein
MVWSLAAQAGLAPRIVFADENEQVVICERVDAVTQPVSSEALSTLCRQIHALPGVSHQLTLATDIEHYLKQLPAHLADQWRAAIQTCDTEKALAKLEGDIYYLCHNDLTPDNLMTRGDNLVAIDWEYAAMGSRYFDVAIACEALPDGERDSMIQQVFGDTLDADLMAAGNQIATLVTALWQSCFAITDAATACRLGRADSQPMTARWHILGVGAIGGLFACRLQSGGADVTLLSRDCEEASRELVLKHTISERFHFPQQTITSNEDPIEHLLVCTKAWAVESAIKAVAPRLSATSVVVLLCNGMGLAEAVAPLIGEAQLVVGSTTSGCRRSSEGELIVSGDGRTQLGHAGLEPGTDMAVALAPGRTRI